MIIESLQFKFTNFRSTKH